MKVDPKVAVPGVAGLVAAGIASASTIAQSLGVAGIAHSSGAAILTSVGVGGTGLLKGTIGGAAAVSLAAVSGPAVIGTAALVALGGAALAARNLLK